MRLVTGLCLLHIYLTLCFAVLFVVRDVMFVVWRRLVLHGHTHPTPSSWSSRHDVMSFITSQFPLLFRYAANLSPHTRVTCKCSGIIWQNMSWSGCQRKLITSLGELSSIETVPMATTLFFNVMLNRLMGLGPLGPLPGGRSSEVVVSICTTWNQKLKKKPNPFGRSKKLEFLSILSVNLYNPSSSGSFFVLTHVFCSFSVECRGFG